MGKTNLGLQVPLIGSGDVVSKQVQQLIIAMFQEYVLPEFAKFNAILEMITNRCEKLENDRKFVITLDDELMNVIGVKLLGTDYLKEREIAKTGTKNKPTQAKKE